MPPKPLAKIDSTILPKDFVIGIPEFCWTIPPDSILCQQRLVIDVETPIAYRDGKIPTMEERITPIIFEPLAHDGLTKPEIEWANKFQLSGDNLIHLPRRRRRVARTALLAPVPSELISNGSGMSGQQTEEKATYIALKSQIEVWRQNPVIFVEKVFGVQPTEQQRRILQALAPAGSRVAVKAGRGVGKTAVMAWALIWHVLLHKNSKSVVTAPSASQLKDALFLEIKTWVERAHPWVRDQLVVTNLRLEVKGAEATQLVTGRTARKDNPDALQGLHAENPFIGVDEVFGVPQEVLERGRGMLTSANARSLLIGNPTVNSGFGYDCFHKHSDRWKTFTLSCLDSPLVSQEYIQEMRQEYGGEDTDGFRIWVKGEFPQIAADQFIPRFLAIQASNRKLAASDYRFAPAILGVDLAYRGGDRSAVYLRQGLMAKRLGVWKDADAMLIGRLIHQWYDEYKIDACFIDMAFGTGVADYLKALGRHPFVVNFGAASPRPEWYRMRSYMWGEMKQWLEQGGSIGDDRELIEDLVTPNLYTLATGQKMIERKDDLRSRGLHSPDCAEALALTFASPIKKGVGEYHRGAIRRMAQTEYDIFA